MGAVSRQEIGPCDAGVDAAAFAWAVGGGDPLSIQSIYDMNIEGKGFGGNAAKVALVGNATRHLG